MANANVAKRTRMRDEDIQKSYARYEIDRDGTYDLEDFLRGETFQYELRDKVDGTKKTIYVFQYDADFPKSELRNHTIMCESYDSLLAELKNAYGVLMKIYDQESGRGKKNPRISHARRYGRSDFDVVGSHHLHVRGPRQSTNGVAITIHAKPRLFPGKDYSLALVLASRSLGWLSGFDARNVECGCRDSARP
jgi:hypothetical protein